MIFPCFSHRIADLGRLRWVSFDNLAKRRLARILRFVGGPLPVTSGSSASSQSPPYAFPRGFFNAMPKKRVRGRLRGAKSAPDGFVLFCHIDEPTADLPLCRRQWQELAANRSRNASSRPPSFRLVSAACSPTGRANAEAG